MGQDNHPELLSRSSLSRSSSDFSILSGDIGDQLDDEDPLRGRFANTDTLLPDSAAYPRHTRSKRVHYHEGSTAVDYHDEKVEKSLLKGEIQIPEPRARQISGAEHALARIMSGGERQMHGLTGRPLVCVIYEDCGDTDANMVI